MVNAVMQQKVPKLFNLGAFLETFLSQLLIIPKKKVLQERRTFHFIINKIRKIPSLQR